MWSRNLRINDPATKALLKNARPYKKSSNVIRRLDENENDTDGSYSLKFSQCLDIKAYDKDLFADDIVGYVQNGQIISTKSFVLFHVCQGDDCYYDAEDDLYIVDLPTYLSTVAVYHAEKRSNYCEACNQFAKVCNNQTDDFGTDDNSGDDAAVDDDAGDGIATNEEGEEGNAEDVEGEDVEQNGAEERDLSSQRRMPSIDCDECQSYKCFGDDDADDAQAPAGYLDEQTSEWIQKLTECTASGAQWNGLDLYLGAMCSSYGDGVELAVFVDEDCTRYTSLESFSNAYNPSYNDNDINFVMYAESYIKAAFSESMSCLEPEYYDGSQVDDAFNGDENYDGSQVNEYCKTILEGEAMNFNECNAADAQEQYAQDDEFSWYGFDLSAEDVDDIEQVCSTVKLLAGEYYHAYDETSSGSWYDRNTSGNVNDNSRVSVVNVWESLSTFALSTTEIAGIVVGSVLIVSMIFCSICCRRRRSAKKVYTGGVRY